MFKPEILTLEGNGDVLRQAFTEGFPVFKPEILTNLRRNRCCTKTSLYCEGFPVFKLEILTF